MIPKPHSLRLHNSAVNNALSAEGHHAPGIESDETDPDPQTSASGWGVTTILHDFRGLEKLRSKGVYS